MTTTPADAPRFGSSGIRGPYGQTATAELALRLGRVLAGEADRAVVGRDARTTGPLLVRALAAGLAAGGADVVDGGTMTTPSLAFAARWADVGVQVTASHNPPPDNGFKVFTPEGASVGADARARIEAGLAGDDAERPPPAPWDGVGDIVEDPALADAHADALLDRAVGPAQTADLSGLDVVLDGANGPGGPFTARLLSAKGARAVTLNAQPDGAFPGHPSEPVPEHLTDLSKAVRRTGADLGLAHDGDGDRLAAATSDGRVLAGDELLLVLAEALSPKRVVVPVDTTMALEDVLAEAAPGAEVVRTRVGDAYISEALATGGGDLGAEPSGSFIFPTVSLCPDGPHAALVVAALVAERGPLEDLVPPTYPLARAALPCPEPAKARVLEAFEAGVRDGAVGDVGAVSTVDGVRVEVEGGWALVRPSGTEPKVRLTVEARDEATLERVRERFEAHLRACLADVGEVDA